MPAIALRSEERIGLIVAVAAHAGLVAWLAFNPPRPAPLALPERMTVTLSDAVALTSTSPQPAALPAADTALEAGAAPPLPAPSAAPSPAPPDRPQPRTEPAQRQAAAAVRSAPAPRAAASAAPARTAPARPVDRPGASRIGTDFLKGLTGAATKGTATTPPAETAGPAVQAALAGAISRQLKPNWVAPQGADAEKLVTVLSWDLNPDGSLAGSPRVVRQDGITDANRAQASRHAEQAVRAVRLAAPFALPAEFYPAWKHIASFRFDRKLSQ